MVLSADDDVDMFVAAIAHGLGDGCEADGRLVVWTSCFNIVGIEDITTAMAWGFGCLAQQVPADLSRLGQRLKAADTQGVVDDTSPTFPIVIFKIVDRICDVWKLDKQTQAASTIAVANPGAAKDPDDDEQATEAYDDLQRLQGVIIDLPMRATCVAGVRRSVKKHLYIQELPCVTKLATQGTSGASKKRIRVGGDSAGAHLEFDDKTAHTITGLQQAHGAARTLVWAICAALTVPITAEAFGGRDAGWVLPPGQTKQQRLLMSSTAADRLVWALVAIRTTDVDMFTFTVNRVILEFVTMLARRMRHPDEIVTDLLGTHEHLFIPRGTDDTASESGRSAGAASLEPGGHAVSTTTVATDPCPRMASQGACNKAGCPYVHTVRGANSGSTRRGGNRGGGGGGWGQSWNNGSQPWGQSGNNGWGGKGKGWNNDASWGGGGWGGGWSDNSWGGGGGKRSKGKGGKGKGKG